ncbi:exoribonuclease II [Buchnera aphidicola]|uniref:exoribonuclease II n=1 Tax=Buchnera aphidicola TaxID=9 RepID=UPI00346490FC
MFLNNPLLKKLKKKLYDKLPRVEGIVKSTEKGFGFLDVDLQKSYFIPPCDMKKVMHGDKISARIYMEKNREIAKPESLIAPFLNRFIGKIERKNNNIFILPDYPFLRKLILCNVEKNSLCNFKTGDWVIAQLISHKLQKEKIFRAKIIKFIAEENSFLVPWKVILSHHNLPINEPKIYPKEIIFNELLYRQDLTHLEFITIDNLNTKDIDDALFITKEKNENMSLLVAIADPTSYISEGTNINQIALERGFTNYLPGFNIPMLPRILSEDLCSLKPNVKRPVLVCRIVVDNKGNILSEKIKFFLAWIKSAAQLVYENVSDWLENIGSWKPKTDEISNQILLLNHFSKIRTTWRNTYALVHKERSEYKFHISEKGEILSVSRNQRRIAHKIIEEAMISANICSAKVLSKYLGFGIYNVHSGFDNINAEHVIEILLHYGIEMTVKEITTLSGFCELHRKLNKLSNNYVSSRIRRLQSFGEISLIPYPHFGLGLKSYATWTSPIRKYGDMVNHRFLKAIIQNKKIMLPNNSITSKISDCRRRNRISERDVEDWLYVIFLNKTKFNENIFDAEITDITRGGIKAQLIENGANIFIPILFLHRNRDEVICNQEKGIVNIKNKIAYRISDIIKVRLKEIKIESRNIIATPVYFS